jgi:hypothetical protein
VQGSGQGLRSWAQGAGLASLAAGAILEVTISFMLILLAPG